MMHLTYQKIRSKHIKVQKNAIYYDKTQHVNFQGMPLFQALKLNSHFPPRFVIINSIVFFNLLYVWILF